jgi:hypothetical protein
MKKSKKQKQILPEVHVLGDLQDVKNLVSGVNKKKTIVVFQDKEQGSYFLEIEGEIQMILPADITELEKEYRLIFFYFFPSRKRNETLVEEKTVPEEPEKQKKTDKEAKEVKEKKDHKAKKDQKIKHHRKKGE